MSNQNSQYGIKEVMDLTICEYATNYEVAKPIVVVDYAQVTGLEHAAERVFIYGGRGNKKLLGFDHTKTVTLKLTLPLVDFKLLSKISGDDIKNKISKLFKAETKMVLDGGASNYITLSKEPLDNTLFVNVLSGYRELEDNLTVVDRGNKSPNENECSVVVEKDGEIRLYLNKITCPVGSEIRAHYTHETRKETQKIVFSADKFPKFVTIKGETLFKNQVTTVDEIYNFIAYKGQIQTNFTLNMSASDPTTLELTVDLYAHKIKETQEELYYEFIKEEEDDILGELTFTNLVPEDGINVKVGEGNFIIGTQQENVIIISPSENNTYFTVSDKTITPVQAGSGKITLKKIGYKDVEITVTVTGADGRSLKASPINNSKNEIQAEKNK